MPLPQNFFFIVGHSESGYEAFSEFLVGVVSLIDF